MGKYRKLKADIRNQAKAKVRQITKKQQEELLEQGRKEGKEVFFTKSRKDFRYPGCQCHLKHEACHFIACNFMVYKGCKIGLKLVFLIRPINFKVQHLTCSPG